MLSLWHSTFGGIVSSRPLAHCFVLVLSRSLRIPPGSCGPKEKLSEVSTIYFTALAPSPQGQGTFRTRRQSNWCPEEFASQLLVHCKATPNKILLVRHLGMSNCRSFCAILCMPFIDLQKYFLVLNHQSLVLFGTTGHVDHHPKIFPNDRCPETTITP